MHPRLSAAKNTCFGQSISNGCRVSASNAIALTLGVGFLEKVYGNALAQELRGAGLAVEQQHKVKVHYHGVMVGDYNTDLLVADMLLVELKTVRALDDVHRMQCTNYL